MKRGHYEYLDEIATADVAFRATGGTLEEMLTACTDATLEVMLPDPSALERKIARKIEVSAENEEMLLFNLLEELIFLKDAKQLFLRVDSISINSGRILAECTGDRIDPQRYVLGVDVKAVTMHEFLVRRTPDGWEARVILDI